MRYVVSIFFILSCLFLNGQNNADTITLSDHIKFKRIPTCFGENCNTGETCSPMPKSNSSSVNMVYENVCIGRIKHGKMFCQTTNGICTKTKISVQTAEGVTQAGKQAAKQFGEPTYSKEENIYVYSWKYLPTNDKELTIRLEVAADLLSAELFVE